MGSIDDLRIVYLGTPHFAVAPLKALLNNGANVVGVVTAPDKPAGRGQRIALSAVKQFALERGLPILQPKNLKDPDFLNSLRSLGAHMFIVVAFRMMPQELWDMPPMGTFNLHASLLPQYRGAAPINWAVMNGEKVTGNTTFLVSHQIDTGNILMQRKEPISPDDTAGDLHDRLMEMGAQLVVETAENLFKGNVSPMEQDALITVELKPAPKLFKDNTRIDWQRSANQLHNFIRGLSPYPSAWTELTDEKGNVLTAKILMAKPSKLKCTQPVGAVNSDEKTHLTVCCGEGALDILHIQIAGKKALPVREFLMGYRNVQELRFV